MSVPIVGKVLEKGRQIADLLGHSRTPRPLILDSLRLQRRPFTAELKNGAKFDLEAGRGDWFTLYECCIRLDYISHGITLGPGDVVVDIGANFGAFAIAASQIVGPEGHVYSFEPHPETFARLKHNVAQNGCTNVTVFNQAVSDTDGEIDFFVYEKSAYSSLYDNVDARAGGWQEKKSVQSRSFNSVIAEMPDGVDLIKIDCEGAEHAIFEAADPDILRRIRQIAMEIHETPGKSIAALKDKIRTSGFSTRETYPFVAIRKDG